MTALLFLVGLYVNVQNQALASHEGDDADAQFFFFLDPTFSNWRYKDYYLRRNLEDLKGLGGTDIIILDSQKGTVFWRSLLPNAIYDRNLKEKDFLAAALKISRDLGLKVWIGLHLTCGHYKPDGRVINANQQFFARDAGGEMYRNPHATYDIFSPSLKRFWFDVIDEIATRYNSSGLIQGFFWDETWFNQSDLFGDDSAKFKEFSSSTFGADPDQVVMERFRSGYYGSFRPQDLWWRRSVLFRQCSNMQFLSELNEYARNKGFRIINRPYNSAHLNNAWIRMGIPHDLSGLAAGEDFNWTSQTGPWGTEIYNNSIVAIYPRKSKRNWGQMCSRALKGLPNCVFLYDWLPFQEDNLKPEFRETLLGEMIPGLRTRLKDFIGISKAWYGSRRVEHWGVLTFQRGLTLRFKNPQQVYKANEATLYELLSETTSAGVTHIEDTEEYSRHSLVLAPDHSLQFLDESTLQDLLNYVERGNTLLTFSPRWSTARQDLSGEKPVGQSILGIKEGEGLKSEFCRISFSQNALVLPGRSFSLFVRPRKDEIISDAVKILARFSRGDPAVSLIQRGKGSILVFHFDLTQALEQKDARKLFREILLALEPPPIAAEGNLEVTSVLLKDYRVLIAVHGKYPHNGSKAVLKLDPNQLGLGKGPFKVERLLTNTEESSFATMSEQELIRGFEVSVKREKQYEVVVVSAVSLGENR